MKKKLKKYAKECRTLISDMETAGKKEENINRLLQIIPIKRTRGSYLNFVLEQIGYTEKYCLIWQVLWVVFAYMMQMAIPGIGGEKYENMLMVLISILSPVLVLLTVEEITKVYQKSMLEIEYATKYSLRNVVMVRMFVLCIVHFVILAAVITALHASLDSGTGKLLVYGFTPMIIMTAVLMKLMRHINGEQLRNVSVGVYVMIAAFIIIGSTERFGWYQPHYFKAWHIVCIAGIMLSVYQFFNLSNSLKRFEICENKRF